jgi:hypothetical protein
MRSARVIDARADDMWKVRIAARAGIVLLDDGTPACSSTDACRHGFAPVR